MKFRLTAFAIHLCLSILVLTAVGAAVIWLWYPFPFYATEDAFYPARMVVMVDVVLGPLLTLILAKKGKRGLKFDFVVIGVIQVGALLYGVHTLYNERPVLMVFSEDRFQTLLHKRVDFAQVPAEAISLVQTSAPTPVYVLPPTDKRERDRIALAALAGQAPMLIHQFDRYRRYEDNFDAILAKAVDPAPLAAREEPEYRRLAEYLEQNRERLPGLAFLPVQGNFMDALAVVDRNSKRIVDYVLVNPFPR